MNTISVRPTSAGTDFRKRFYCHDVENTDSSMVREEKKIFSKQDEK
jgi:hypothetical protein